MERLLWIDLETTGLDPYNDYVLEIGLIITDFDLHEYGRISSIVTWPGRIALYNAANDFVKAMHSANGLWDEIISTLDQGDGGIVHPKIIDAKMCAFLDEHHFLWCDGDEPVTWYPAGSSVHFDVRFIEENFPELAKRLHHRHLDVSSIKMFLGPVCGNEYDHGPTDPHRALADLDNDIDALRASRNYFLAEEGDY